MSASRRWLLGAVLPLAACGLLDTSGEQGLPDGSTGFGPCVFGEADGGRPLPPDGGASFSGDVQPIVAVHCAPCHARLPEQSGTLDLAPARAWSQLVGAPASAGCDLQVLRVAPGQPDASMLWLKLTADPRRCNAPMPLGSPGLLQLCPADTEVIGRWILEGALEN